MTTRRTPSIFRDADSALIERAARTCAMIPGDDGLAGPVNAGERSEAIATCETCGRDFGSAKSAQQHREAKGHLPLEERLRCEKERRARKAEKWALRAKQRADEEARAQRLAAELAERQRRREEARCKNEGRAERVRVRAKRWAARKLAIANGAKSTKREHERIERDRCATTTAAPKTLKDARALGYRERRTDEYGGEEIALKGHVLAKDPEVAVSATEWGRRGFRVPADTVPHAIINRPVGGGNVRVDYPVYRRDQVVAKRKSAGVPPKRVDLLAAVFAINRAAKRYRDAASRQYQSEAFTFATRSREIKEMLYDLKDQAVAHLVEEGVLRRVGWHRFGPNWAEVLEGRGYRFHQPARPPEGVTPSAVKDLGESIEAKPREASGPRLKDAIFTLREYLADKPRVDTFAWARPGQDAIHMLASVPAGYDAAGEGSDNDDSGDSDDDLDDYDDLDDDNDGDGDDWSA